MTAWLNLALGAVLMVVTIVTVALLITGHGLPLPAAEYSLVLLLAWILFNWRRQA